MARIDQETYSSESCRGGSDKKVSFEHSADQTEANEGVLGMIMVYKIPLIALGALVSVTLCHMATASLSLASVLFLQPSYLTNLQCWKAFHS